MVTISPMKRLMAVATASHLGRGVPAIPSVMEYDWSTRKMMHPGFARSTLFSYIDNSSSETGGGARAPPRSEVPVADDAVAFAGRARRLEPAARAGVAPRCRGRPGRRRPGRLGRRGPRPPGQLLAQHF